MSTAAPLQQANADLQQNNVQLAQQTNSKRTTEFADARPSATAQGRLQVMADNSAQARQLKAYSHMMQNDPRTMQLKSMQEIMHKTTVQRVDDEEPLQAKFGAVQKVEEEESLQAKPANKNTAQLVEQATPKLNNTVNNTGLPNQLKAGIESLSGMSMDHVKVHYNSSKPAQLQAHAYAQGSEIHVAAGQEQHLPHEAWHVVQQAQGRVKPTLQMKTGVPVNDDVGLEAEADVMGAKALEVAPVQLAKEEIPGAKKLNPSPTTSNVMPAQRTEKPDEDMVNAEKFKPEMKQSGTEDEIAAIFDLNNDATHGLYMTDAPSRECAAVWSGKEGKVTKVVLPEFPDLTGKAMLTHGVSLEQQYRALALHELLHVRQGMHNLAQSPESRLGTNAKSFGPEQIVSTLRTILGLVPELVVAPEGSSLTSESKGNALRKHVIARLIYLTTECIRSIDAEQSRNVDARLILLRFNLEAPTVIAELERTVNEAIASKPDIAVGWQSIAKYLSGLSAELFEAGK